ncbi:MAG: phosphotransferase [Anaerolineae bacterium]|nr:phosphotransferase [Anaerolineae bacterium]
MLEKPDLKEEKIVICLQDEYGVHALQVAFLPIGADMNTAVYHVVADDGMLYFLKLRSGVFDETSVTLPKFLSERGIEQIIAPLMTRIGQLWATLDTFKVILYPFVKGCNGYEIAMSDQHWQEFGLALKRIHAVELPPPLRKSIRRETYSPRWRESVKRSLARLEDDDFEDPVAINLAAFLKAKRDEVLYLVKRAEELAQILQTRPPEFVLCHSDVHAGNVLIGSNGAFYIVDWDDPIMAPKERDLMFVGGGQGFVGHTAREEETLFYQGYGPTEINPIALAYYRYERIVVDIAIYCEQLFLSNEGGEDREQSFQYLMSNFIPNGTIEMAYRADGNHCVICNA